PLPYKNSDRLVRIVENIPAAESFTGGPERTTSMSPDSFMEWRTRTKTLSGMAMEMPISMTLVPGEAIRLSGQRASPPLLTMLGVQPAHGRVVESRQEEPGFDKVVMLSYGVGQKDFGGESKILGSVVTLDDASFTVVGLMPRDFNYLDAHTEFWASLA